MTATIHMSLTRLLYDPALKRDVEPMVSVTAEHDGARWGRYTLLVLNTGERPGVEWLTPAERARADKLLDERRAVADRQHDRAWPPIAPRSLEAS